MRSGQPWFTPARGASNIRISLFKGLGKKWTHNGSRWIALYGQIKTWPTLINHLGQIKKRSLRQFNQVPPATLPGAKLLKSWLILDFGGLFNEQLNQRVNTGITNKDEYTQITPLCNIGVYSWFKKNRAKFIVYLIYTTRTKAKQDPETQHESLK